MRVARCVLMKLKSAADPVAKIGITDVPAISRRRSHRLLCPVEASSIFFEVRKIEELVALVLVNFR